MSRLFVGIDPGTQTGWAIWDADKRQITDMRTLTCAEAMLLVQTMHAHGSLHSVTFEDASLNGRRDKSPGAALGAGSIRRESQIWGEWLRLLGVPHRAISARQKGAKVSQDQFVRLTGKAGRTSQHARDAAMMVLGRTA
jgi:hypothetical protein